MNMRTNIEFTSPVFPPYPNEDEELNPGRYGKRLAEFLAEQLPKQGFVVTGVEAEDWGWRVTLQNLPFPLWIGCGNYEEYENGFLCFIEPSKPFVRKWFKKIDTTEIVERLAEALETVLKQSDKTNKLRWWTEEENRRG